MARASPGLVARFSRRSKSLLWSRTVSRRYQAGENLSRVIPSAMEQRAPMSGLSFRRPEVLAKLFGTQCGCYPVQPRSGDVDESLARRWVDNTCETIRCRTMKFGTLPVSRERPALARAAAVAYPSGGRLGTSAPGDKPARRFWGRLCYGSPASHVQSRRSGLCGVIRSRDRKP